MNEKAINDGYKYFVETGYQGTIDDYKTLLNTNGDAVNDTYKYFVNTGYKGTVNDFVTLFGIGEKKNPVGNGTGEEEVMVSSIEDIQEPGSSEPSLQPSNEQVDSALTAGAPDFGVEETEEDPSILSEMSEMINIGQGNQVNPEDLIKPPTVKGYEPESWGGLKSLITQSTQEERSDPNYKGLFKVDTTEEVVEQPSDFFDESLQQITPDLISKTEENVVPLMNYHFNDYGFTFTEADFTGNEMTVSAANGETLKVELDALFFKGKYSDELKQFLQDNKEESTKLHQLEAGYVKKQQKIQGEQDVENMVKDLTTETNSLRDEYSEYLMAKNFYDKNNLSEMDPNEVVYVEGPDGQQMATTPKVLAEKIALASQNIAISNKNLAVKGKELDEVVGGWYEMRSEQSSIAGFGYNALLDGSARIGTQMMNRMIDAGTYMAPAEGGLMSQNEYRTKVLTKAKEAGLLGDTYTEERIQEIISNDEEYERFLELIEKTPGTTTEIKSAGSIKAGISASTRKVTTTLLDDIESKILDEIRKEIKYDVKPGDDVYANPFSKFANDPKYDGRDGMLEMSRRGLRYGLGMDETTVEATQEAKKGFWGGALIGVTESIPAMLGPAPVRIFNMISQVEDHINEEMENDPDFADISEAEKTMFTVPLGIVVGVLENLGFRNAIAQKGLASKILLLALKKSGKDITGQSFRQVVKKEVNSLMGQGLLLVTASGLAEFETGLAQEIADIGFKEAYNYNKEKEMFRTPESFGDGVKQVIRAGLQEAVGGFVIGTPSAIIQTATAGDFTGLGDGVFEMYEQVHKEPVVRDAFIQRTKERILNGDITKKEGQREIDMYDKVNGVMDQIPSDLPTNQKKELLGNLLRQQELQDDIDKYNKQLTKRQQQELLDLENDVERIVRSGNIQNQQEAQETELNTQAINELKEEGVENPTPEQIKTKRDAIQKSSPKKVDVQESTEGSQEVGDGNTQGQPTQESQDSQTDLDSQTQEEVDDLTSIFNEQTGVQEETETETTTEQTTTKGVEVDSENNNVTIEKNDGTTVSLPGVSVSENVSVTETAGDPKAVRILPSLLRQAKNAGKAIAKLIPNAHIVVHATEDAYNQAVSAANKGTRGTFSPNTNTIHINSSKANTRTVAHEVMHAVLLKKLGINADLNKVTKRMLDAVVKAMPKDSNLKEVIENFANDYAIEEQNEEQVSELFGYLSAAYTKLDGPTKNIVKRWLQKAAKAVGLPVNITEFTKEEADMIEFFNTVSKKVREGTEVTEGDIEVIPGEVVEDAEGPVPENIPDDGPSIDLEVTEKNQKDRGGIDMSKIKRGSINDLSGVNAFVFAADQATYGNIESPSGLEFMFNGGYLYPYGSESQGSNAVWVFSAESAANKVLNKAKESDGVGLVMSQASDGITGNLQFYDFLNAEIENAIEKGASPKEMVDYINKKLADKTKDGGDGKITTYLKKNGLPTQIKNYQEIQDLFKTTNFEVRGQFARKFMSAESYNKFGIYPFEAKKTIDGDIESVVNDPSLKKIQYGDIISAIEFDQDGKPFKLNEGDPGYHPAYPWALPGKPMMVFNNAVDVRKVYPKAKPVSGNQTLLGKRTKPVAARSAMGGQYVAKVPKDINVEGAPIKEKTQKAPVDKLAKMYEMKKNGVIFNKPGVNRVALEDWANSLGFTVKPTRGDIGELTGFKLIKPDGKVYTPTKEKAQRSVDEKAQKTFNKFDSPLEIINKARDLNFTDPAILDYLTRVRKFTKTEVRDLMKVNADLLSIIPPSMGNIVGGMKAGIKLFNKVSNHYNKLITKNAKAKTKLSEQEIMDQAMDFLRAQPEYKKMADAVLKGISTEQMVLEMDVARALGGKQSTNLNAAIRKARIILRAKTKGQKELRKIQRELRNFMRKTLPADIYSKSDALKLMKEIQDASKDNIQQVMNNVMEFAAQKNNVRLDKSITDLLNPKNTVKKISNILKGVKIDEGTRKRLASIKKRIDAANKTKDEKTGKIRVSLLDDVVKYLNALEAEYDAIDKKPIKTEADYTDMADLNIIMNMVNANKLMGNKDITKVNLLSGVETELKQIITAGRTLLKEQLRKAHVEYRRQFEHVYQDVTGREESFEDQAKRELKEDGVENPTEAEIFDKVTDIIEVLKDTKKTRERENASKVKKVKGRFKKLANNIVQRLGNIMGMNSDLFLLMDKISLLPAELFEGVTQEEITKKIDAANREMKGRMLMNDALIISKFQELFGKKYKSIVTSFGRKTEAIDLPDGTEMVLSPNQMYYLYNQYKDSSNHPGLQKTFSTDEKGVAKVMNEITTRLESEQYKNLKEFADWQVEILYPMLYNHYNEAYQDIYRTQMPYNVNYAGMVYRDGFEAEGVRLIPGTEKQKANFQTVVSANSTKMREDNKNAIQPTDGTNALYTYMRDMEYFSAYARPVNDINKLFTNDLIESEITKLHGKSTLKAIKMAIQKIANKGTAKEDVQMDNAVDIMQDMFILSRLGINPVVTLKQLTSFVTYASDIGYVNWMKNAALSRFGKGQDVKAIWKEIAANSTYLQDRDAKSMTKAIEMYSDKAMESIFPDVKVGGKRIMSGANKESLINILMYTTKVGDRGAIYLGGVPNYVYYKNKALEAGKTEQEAIDEAIIKFERDTKRSQQSTDLQDRDAYQTKGPIFRALNMFLTTPRQYLRKEAYAIRNMYRLMSSGGKSGKGNKMDAGRIFLTYHVIMPVFFQFVANGMPGLLADWDDEDKKDLAWAAILGNINALFLYGDLAVMIKNLFSDKPETFLTADSLPILTQGSETAKKISRYMKLKDPVKKQEALYTALAEASQFTGLPVNNVRKIFKNMEQLIEGGEDPAKVIMRLFNYSEYQIMNEAERKRNKKSKRKAKKKAGSNPMISGDPMNSEDPMNDKTNPMLGKDPMNSDNPMK